jgi:hypothetical protein
MSLTGETMEKLHVSSPQSPVRETSDGLSGMQWVGRWVCLSPYLSVDLFFNFFNFSPWLDEVVLKGFNGLVEELQESHLKHVFNASKREKKDENIVLSFNVI